jgi:hypothetical protein
MTQPFDASAQQIQSLCSAAGPRTLCNACGLQYVRSQNRQIKRRPGGSKASAVSKVSQQTVEHSHDQIFRPDPWYPTPWERQLLSQPIQAVHVLLHVMLCRHGNQQPHK